MAQEKVDKEKYLYSVLMAAQHIIRDVMRLNVSRDSLGHKLVEVGSLFVVAGSFKRWCDDELHLARRQQPTTCGKPLV